ncbi:hypothetical protein DW624_RS00735 [Enterococcus hirae]
MKVKKGNRLLTILEEEKNFYTAQGYDVVELDEQTNSYKVIEPATGGKNYTVVQYNQLLEKNKKLLEENQELKQRVSDLEQATEPDREQLKARLVELGIEFTEKTSTAKLVKLLKEAEEAKE